MASSRRPRMSLPPELGAIDHGWGADEQPTVARPSRMPTSPVRPQITVEAKSGEAPLPPDLRPDLANREPLFDERITTIPDIPPDEYARRMMAAAPNIAEAVTEAPDGPDLELDLGITEGPGDAPTAAPPGDGLSDVGHLPPLSNLGVSLNSTKNPSDVPAPPLSHPRHSAAAFSGRFESAPVGPSPEQSMKDKFAMGDFSGALEIAEAILNANHRHPEAEGLARKCREVLHDMFTSRIGDLQASPNIIMTPDQIRWLSLDHRAGFLLSMVDGISSVDDLLDISGMKRLDALRIICSLLDQKVITLN